MKLRNVKDITTLTPGTRVLVTICIPEDNRYEMYTGTVSTDGTHVNYDDGKTDMRGTLAFYMNCGVATICVLEV